MKYKIIITVIVLISLICHSTPIHSKNPNGYHIEVNAPFAKGSMAYLAKYWKGNPYTVDSVLVSQDGSFSFSKQEKLIPGQYLLYIKPHYQIELLIDKEQKNIQIKLDEDLSKSVISGNKDTELFWNYINQYAPYSSKIAELSQVIENSENETEREQSESQYILTLKEIEQLMDQHVRKYKDTWFSSFIKASQSINTPFPFPKDKEQYIENKQYLVNHYLDNIDLKDIRLWNTNFFTKQLDTYLFDIISQHPDSIAQAACDLVAKTKSDDKAFEQMLSHLYNEASTSHIMGMENVWAKLAEDYIFDQNISWIDSTLYSNLKAQYSLIELNRLGMKGQDLKLMTINGDSVHTNDIEANYTLLYFYSTSCSHCDKEIPILRNEFYPKYQDRGLKVVAINVDRDIEGWENFVQKHNIDTEGWYNLFDPNYSSQYWLKYDVSGTPSLYFLDKNKQILARKINLENLEKYLERILN